MMSLWLKQGFSSNSNITSEIGGQVAIARRQQRISQETRTPGAMGSRTPDELHEADHLSPRP